MINISYLYIAIVLLAIWTIYRILVLKKSKDKKFLGGKGDVYEKTETDSVSDTYHCNIASACVGYSCGSSQNKKGRRIVYP